MEFVLFHAWGFSEWAWQPNIHQNKDSKNTLSTTGDLPSGSNRWNQYLVCNTLTSLIPRTFHQTTIHVLHVLSTYSLPGPKLDSGEGMGMRLRFTSGLKNSMTLALCRWAVLIVKGKPSGNCCVSRALPVGWQCMVLWKMTENNRQQTHCHTQQQLWLEWKQETVKLVFFVAFHSRVMQ